MALTTIETKLAKSPYAEGHYLIIYFNALGTKVRTDSATEMTFVDAVAIARDTVHKDENLGSFCVIRVLYNSLQKHMRM